MGERKQVEGPSLFFFFFLSEGNTIAFKRCYCSKCHSRAQTPSNRFLTGDDGRSLQQRLPFAGIINSKAVLNTHELSSGWKK